MTAKTELWSGQSGKELVLAAPFLHPEIERAYLRHFYGGSALCDFVDKPRPPLRELLSSLPCEHLLQAGFFG